MKTIILILFLSLQVFAQSELLNLFADGYLPETESFKNRVALNGGTISGASLKAVDDFVKDVSTIRSKLTRVNLICGNDTAAMRTPLFFNYDGSTTPIGYSRDSLIGIVSADYSQSNGLLSSSTGPKVILTGITPISMGGSDLNSTHLSIYQANNTQNANGVIGGNNSLLYTRYTTNALLYKMNVGSNINAGANANSIGFYVVSRVAADSSFVYKNGSLFVANASTSSAESNIIWCVGGTAATTGANALIRGYTFGYGLTSSEQALLNTAIEKFNDALGRGVQ